MKRLLYTAIGIMALISCETEPDAINIETVTSQQTVIPTQSTPATQTATDTQTTEINTAHWSDYWPAYTDTAKIAEASSLAIAIGLEEFVALTSTLGFAKIGGTASAGAYIHKGHAQYIDGKVFYWESNFIQLSEGASVWTIVHELAHAYKYNSAMSEELIRKFGHVDLVVEGLSLRYIGIDGEFTELLPANWLQWEAFEYSMAYALDLHNGVSNTKNVLPAEVKEYLRSTFDF